MDSHAQTSEPLVDNFIFEGVMEAFPYLAEPGNKMQVLSGEWSLLGQTAASGDL